MAKIIADPTVFPNNVVVLVADAIEALGDPDEITVVKRPLREEDPALSTGVFASQWTPDDESYETGRLGGYGRQEPTIQKYLISIQAMVKDGDEIHGLAMHSTFAKMIRDTLLRNPEVGVALSSLSNTGGDGLTERVQKRKVQTQRYISNEISGSWIYLATLEFLIETETT